MIKPKHDHTALIFPKEFLWGATTSAYQVEGGNVNSDWEDFKSAGKADDQYNRYEEDFELAKFLGHNSHRLSIEWARIEPREGEFDQTEIEHYKKVLKALKDRKLTVCLTLWHFTSPKWLAKKGGWENLKAPYYFERFVKKIVPYLRNWVDLWITINEPGIYAFMGYLGGDDAGSFPPGKKSNLAALKVNWNFARAHKKAYIAIHKLVPGAKVGIAQNTSSFEAYHKHSFREQLAVGLSDLISNHSFYALTKGYHDFLGLNYYFHHRFNTKSGLIPDRIDPNIQERDVSDLGWEVYPEGLFSVLTDLSDGLPIYITECGIASTNDDRRTRFLINYLQEVYKAIQVGVRVRGFFYWSLIDNFEWHRGFDPRFGLVEVDYETESRTVRPSALVYKEIIKRNGIPHDLLKLLGHGIQVKDVLRGGIEE